VSDEEPDLSSIARRAHARATNHVKGQP
jgi:hypothetical protein